MKVKVKKEGKVKEFKLISSWEDVTLEKWLQLIDFETGSNGTSSLHLGINGDIDANVRDNGYIYIYNAGDFTKYTMYNAHTTGMFQTTSKFASIFIGGNLSNESQVDQIKLFSSTDNIATLTASLYGIRTYT